MQTAENTLTPNEQFILRALSAHADLNLSQRAQLILNWSIDPDPNLLAVTLGLQVAQVQHWLKAFAKTRLAIFPPDALWLASRGLSGSISVKQLCKRYKIDLAHARHVAALALQLFDQTRSIHQLPIERRRLLETAALLHNLGVSIDDARHHLVGRDELIKYSLKGYTAAERDQIACLIFFHRKTVNPKPDRLFASLAAELQRETLILAALLRVGDGLDYATDQLTHIRSIEVKADRIEIQLEGLSAPVGATRAQRKADLWDSLFKTPFHFSIDDQAVEPAAYLHVRRAKRPTLRPNDLLSEAGRSIMVRHFQRARELEERVSTGDEEAIHDLRVAVRRLRIALRLTRAEFKPKPIERWRAAWSELANRLGDVRNLDVILDRSLDFAQKNRSSDINLDVWLDHLKLLRASAQAALRTWLKSKRGQKFLKEFEAFATTSAAAVRSEREPRRVRDVMPALIWKQFGAVRAYESMRPLTLKKLHALRIEAKRLRDGLEFFLEILRPEASELIERLVRLQEHLGALQDATVTADLLKEFLLEQPQDAGALAYQVVIEREVKTGEKQFSEVWKPIVNKSFRKLLARLLGEV